MTSKDQLREVSHVDSGIRYRGSAYFESTILVCGFQPSCGVINPMQSSKICLRHRFY